MDNLEEKLSSILSDPETMQKLITMAQSLSAAAPAAPAEPNKQGHGALELPQLDLGMVQKLSGLMGQGGIDSEQKNLLQALRPYLSRQRLQKLEHAMQAAKMARLAATVLGQQGLKFPSAR